MKFVKGSAATMQASALGDASSSANTNTSLATHAILLYKGAVPTFAEFSAAMNAPNFQDATTTNREPYLNYQDLAESRKADYLGGVTTRMRPFIASPDLSSFELPYAGNMGFATAFTNTGSIRGTHILTSGVPTWFILAFVGNIVINMTAANPLQSTAYQVVFGLMGTVGDEKSQADLRIMGGQVFANSTTLTDQSRSLVLSNLKLALN